MSVQRLDLDPSSVIDTSRITEADPLSDADLTVDEVGRRLVDAAIDCIDQLGYGRVSTAEVALRAGVSQSEHYLRFPARAQLMAAVGTEVVRRWSATYRATRSAEALQHSGDPRDAWVAVARRGWDRPPSTERRVWQELVMASLTDDQLRKRLLPISLQVGDLAVQDMANLPGADRVPADILIGAGATLLQMSDLDTSYFDFAHHHVPGVGIAMELMMGRLYDEYVGQRDSAW